MVKLASRAAGHSRASPITSTPQSTMEFMHAVGAAVAIELIKALAPTLFETMTAHFQAAIANLSPFTLAALHAVQKIMTELPSGF